jgi:ABC-type uncharacterized transport system permease subunit
MEISLLIAFVILLILVIGFFIGLVVGSQETPDDKTYENKKDVTESFEYQSYQQSLQLRYLQEINEQLRMINNRLEYENYKR